MLALILLCGFISPIITVKVIDRGCYQYKDIKPLKPIDMEAFEGKWYTIKRYHNSMESNSICGFTEYQTSNPLIKVNHTQWNMDKNKTEKFHYVMKALYDNIGAFELAALDNRLKQFNYVILDTDYNNYAVVWLCEEIERLEGGYSKQGLWIYSRHKTITPKSHNIAINVIKANGLSCDLQTVDQHHPACDFTNSLLPSISLITFLVLTQTYFN